MKSAEIVEERIERLSFQTGGLTYVSDGKERRRGLAAVARSSGDRVTVEADIVMVDANYSQRRTRRIAGCPRDEWDQRVLSLQNQFLLSREEAWWTVAREVLGEGRG